jgi:fumarate hydratase subunit alpha
MRTIPAEHITRAIGALMVRAALHMPVDVMRALKDAYEKESRGRAKDALRIIIENARLAQKNRIPICQDTGMAVVYCALGQDMRVKGDIDVAIQEGIVLGSQCGYTRSSIVRDPLVRKNTGTNGPAVIHYSFVPGASIRLALLLKGFGSENKSAVCMLNPTASYEEVLDVIVSAVIKAGPNACPPFVVGVGIGGTADKAMEMSKEVLLQSLGRKNRIPWCSRLERDVLRRVNASGLGALGMGGKTTALAVKVKTYPTHIAGLPVAVNINCHALRRAEVRL